MTKSTITREQLEEWVSQFDEDGGCDATDRQLEALIRQSLAAMDSSESVELPLDYLQGHKDGLEWAAQLAEANHPETGDWLYDDPIELAKAIRKGPDMPPVQPVADSEPVAEVLSNRPGNDTSTIDRALPVGTQLYRHAQQPVVPEEWTIADAVKFCKETGRQDAGSAMDAWNACRAAMLQTKSLTSINPAPDLVSLQKKAESIIGNYPGIPDCWCRTCRPVVLNDMHFVVCPDCGNKRCPRANDHRNACTGSNEPGQEGSAYPDTLHESKP